jgi:pantoate--beta-alanine ligase
VSVERASAPLEGRQHPDHFRGLTTVMARLFIAFNPGRVYVGQKDAQENLILGCLVRDLAFPLEVVVCPTVREPDGLALSRRNSGLSPQERRAAAVLYRALEAARRAFADGERDGDMLRACLSSRLASEPLAREEYVSAADPETLDELERVAGRALLSLAARIGKTRLIDNLIVGEEP